jgi:tetratricopeptide (TPR) repeat protein
MTEVESGRPVLVLLNLGLPRRAFWHYAVVVGYDAERNRVVLRSGREERSVQKARAWLRRWDWGGRWAMVLLEPGEWPSSADRTRLLDALAAFEDSDPTAAGPAWQAASVHWPEEPIVWLGVGNSAYRSGDWLLAREAYARALQLAPDHLPARYNLAVSLKEQGAACEGLGVLDPPPEEGHPLAAAFAQLKEELERECSSPRVQFGDGRENHGTRNPGCAPGSNDR